MVEATPQHLARVKVEGFRSYKALDLVLRRVNVLIGANGSGKSNFIDLLRLLAELVHHNLQEGVGTRGGADKILHLGPKVTPQLSATFSFGSNAYLFTLKPTVTNTLLFVEESGRYRASSRVFGRGHPESKLPGLLTADPGAPTIPDWIHASISSWQVYHFHDTSALAAVRRPSTTRDYERLREDAENLPAYLLHLRDHQRVIYDRIVETVRLAAPFFRDFLLRPLDGPGGDTNVLLEWTQPGTDYPFHPSQLSDGTLRFICLSAALLQPDPPKLLVVDEPELGLHPYALALLADMIQRFPEQIVVSTQSPTLLSHFEASDVVVAARDGGATRLRRLGEDELRAWLGEYTLGDLWEKNVIDGGPRHEDG